MAGTLFVVATPIGHLDDISVRALRTLREVAVVAAEDTRRSGNLLRHFGISTPLVSLHLHNEHLRAAQLLDRLVDGESVALVSDAGTPGVSDPGSQLVRQARARGVRVEPIPGPSAVAAAISIAGLEGTEFTFLGFPPIKAKARNTWFGRLASVHGTAAAVFFEAPHRISQTLEELANYVKSPILVMRELTKIHEEVLQGDPQTLANALTKTQGELTVVVPHAPAQDAGLREVTDEELIHVFGQITESGEASSRRESIKAVAERFGVSTRRVYDATKHRNGLP